MTIINPFLLSGPAQIEAYQKKRISDWEQQKGESEEDFDYYFNSIVEQWNLDDFNETMINIDTLGELDGIDIDMSAVLHEVLKSNDILNEYGYLNLKNTSSDLINTIINDLTFLTDEQVSELETMIDNIQNNKPVDYETYSKGMFTFLPASENLVPYTVTEAESNSIWEHLNQNNIVDDYGILLVEPNSSELSNAVDGIPGLTTYQKERVLLLLNKHPELAYHKYIENFMANQTYNNDVVDDYLPGVGVYTPDEIELKLTEGLSKEELNFIRSIALMEWNIMLISQKSIHKSRKKSAEKVENTKRKEKVEEEQYLAQIEAKYQQEFKSRLKGKKKGK